MILSDFDVFEGRNGVLYEDSRGTIKRDQIRGDGLVVNAHEAHRKARGLFARKSGLEEANDTLLFFSDAQQKNVGLPAGPLGFLVSVDLELVGGDQWNSSPSHKGRTKERDHWRWYAAARTLPAKRSDGARVGEKERGLLPHFSQKLLQIVRCRSAFAGLDALAGRDIFQKAVVWIIDEFAFLIFLYVCDGEPQLLAHLIAGIAVEIGNASVDVQDGGNSAEGVFARLFFVVDIRFRKWFFIFLAADDANRFVVHDAVDAQRPGFERFPVQKADEPPRLDRSVRGRSLADSRKLKRCAFTERVMRRSVGHGTVSFMNSKRQVISRPKQK
jgi:hypothetical protein